MGETSNRRQPRRNLSALEWQGRALYLGERVALARSIVAATAFLGLFGVGVFLQIGDTLLSWALRSQELAAW